MLGTGPASEIIRQKLFATSLRFRDIKGLIQSHTPSEWGSRDLNSSLSGVNACVLSASLVLLGICVSLG